MSAPRLERDVTGRTVNAVTLFNTSQGPVAIKWAGRDAVRNALRVALRCAKEGGRAYVFDGQVFERKGRGWEFVA